MRLSKEKVIAVNGKLNHNSMVRLWDNEYKNSTEDVVKNGLLICRISELRRMINDLTDLAEIIENETGVIL